MYGGRAPRGELCNKVRKYVSKFMLDQTCLISIPHPKLICLKEHTIPLTASPTLSPLPTSLWGWPLLGGQLVGKHRKKKWRRTKQTNT